MGLRGACHKLMAEVGYGWFCEFCSTTTTRSFVYGSQLGECGGLGWGDGVWE